MCLAKASNACCESSKFGLSGSAGLIVVLACGLAMRLNWFWSLLGMFGLSRGNTVNLTNDGRLGLV